ncbi:pancreatic triacylglycerol lipase-like [Anopheles stephensi]|uniref:pancreatic triacylglycerol lipase-like n=1 Tax=Anopheles stephensi TaxID=30069 RepID=UPI001658AADB|nr:pancreatic triacylglycerol lipase-like [Anopheles stephensi]
MDFVPRLVGVGFVLLFAVTIDTSADSIYDKELESVKLYFYSPSFKHEQEVESFEPSPEIDLSRQLKVLIHGWNADRNHISIAPIRTAYLVQDAHNLLVADWSDIAYRLYPTARDLVLPISKRIGSSLSRFVQRMGIQHGQVHVIGHSLGAHIAGNVGRYFDGKLARVTALDPAGPLYKFESKDAVGPDTAQFVDVIHTDGLTLGEDVVRGHADFFPNSGLPPQPGCETLDILTLHGCSHFRSTGFFAESIQLPNNFIACACSREEILRMDEICLPDVRDASLRECVPMGEALQPSARGTFFVRTSRVPPYGLGYHANSGTRI